VCYLVDTGKLYSEEDINEQLIILRNMGYIICSGSDDCIINPNITDKGLKYLWCLNNPILNMFIKCLYGIASLSAIGIFILEILKYFH
jgi:hypothetical protein